MASSQSRPVPQIAGQTAFFVAIFRQQTRERVFDFLERLVPDVLPFLHLNGLTPMQVGRLLMWSRVVSAAAAFPVQHAGQLERVCWQQCRWPVAPGSPQAFTVFRTRSPGERSS